MKDVNDMSSVIVNIVYASALGKIHSPSSGLDFDEPHTKVILC